MIRPEEVYCIGKFTRTHGVQGEMALSFTDDVWDRVEANYLFLMVDGLPVPFFLEEWRFRNDTTALLKFQHIDAAAHNGINIPFALMDEQGFGDFPESCSKDGMGKISTSFVYAIQTIIL